MTGGLGQLGFEVATVLEARGADVVAAARDRLDVSDRSQVFCAVEELVPDIVVHCAAWTAVDECESNPERAYMVNALGTRWVAQAASRVGAHLVYISTDYVFDGESGPYREWDQTGPLSVYGQSKLAGEQEIHSGFAIVRTSWVCGERGSNFVKTMLRLARASSGEVRVVCDQWGHPSLVGDLAPRIGLLAMERLGGIWHLTNAGETNWFEFARAIFKEADADPARVVPITTAELWPPRPAKRPKRATLENFAWLAGGFDPLPHWEESLGRLVRALAQ